MWTGQQTLKSIEDTLKQLREAFERINTQFQGTSRELVELRQEEGNHYKSLARIRLDQIIGGEVAAGLDAADRRVTELLAERDQALTDLQGEIDGVRKQETQLEKDREELSSRVADAAAALDSAEADVQEQLEKDPVYQTRFEKAGRADSIARHAEEKTAQAEADRVKKGRPYEDDPLFSYLWKRAFETSRYSGNRLIRYLDTWVAGLCNYSDARPNYAMLLEIPKRLGEHAARLRAAADQEFADLKALEEKAAGMGGLPEKRAALDDAEQQVDRIDRQIQEKEQHMRSLLEQRAAYASGEDEFFRRCIDTLATAFQRENLSALHQYARATSTAKDDVIVYELSDLEEKKNSLENTVTKHRQIYEQQLARLKELETVRAQFKQKRYDDIHSVFQNGDLLLMLLNQFLQGGTSGDALWQTLQEQHRYRRIRSNPVFGSGGFGQGGMWRLPIPRGGGSWPLPIPPGGGWRRGPGRGGFGSRGGFRTGGGI